MPGMRASRMAASSSHSPLPPHPFSHIPCFLCRSCTSIVAWDQHLLLREAFPVIPDAFLLTAIESTSVIVGHVPFVRGMHILKTLTCSTCEDVIGWKVDVASGPLAQIFYAGTYILFARRVFYWDTIELADPVWRPSDIRR